MKTYTKEQLLKKYDGKFIHTCINHYLNQDVEGNWITTYTVYGVSSKIKENYNLPKDCIIN